MITIVWRTDAHLADQSPQSRKDNWSETILGKLRQTCEIASAEKAQAIVDGGDLFHVKSPSRNSHHLTQRVASLHAEYGIPVFACVGNHDCKYADYAYLDEQPLGVLFSSGGLYRPLYNGYDQVIHPPTHLRVETDLKVRFVGIPYHGPKYDMSRFESIEKGDEDYLVAVAHVLASPAGGEMFQKEDIIKYGFLDDLDPDLWCFLPGTKVIDWNGRAVPIEEMRESTSLAGREGVVAVEEVHPIRQVDEEVIVFDVEGVPADLIPGVTKEHPFWVTKGLKCRLPSRSSRRCHPDKPRTSHPCSRCHESPKVIPDWHPAGAVEPGDYVAIPVPCLAGQLAAPGLARLLGLYVAEGHIIENRNKEPAAGVGWSLHEDEHRLRRDVGELVQDNFGLDIHPYESCRGRCVQLCAHGLEVTEFFLSHGGRYSSTKKLSSWVWGLAAASRLELLIGWLDGDGHARDPSRYDRIKAEVLGATTSPQLATQMYLLALSVGLRPYYTIRPEREVVFSGVCGGHTSQALPCHCISFYGDDAAMLAARMGIKFPDRSKTKVAGFFADGLYWVRVRGVRRKSYKGPVYNIRTSTQEYVAGLLLTHNCFGHWHKDQGIHETKGGKKIVNIGALSRGSIAQDDTGRAPSCAVIKFDTKGFDIDVRPLDVKPADEVFDLEGRARAEARTSMIDTFVDTVNQRLVDRQTEDVEEVVQGMKDLPQAVRERALFFLEQAQK